MGTVRETPPPPAIDPTAIVPLTPRCPSCGLSLAFLTAPHWRRCELGRGVLPTDPVEQFVRYAYAKHPLLYGRTAWARWGIFGHLFYSIGGGYYWGPDADGLLIPIDIDRKARTYEPDRVTLISPKAWIAKVAVWRERNYPPDELADMRARDARLGFIETPQEVLHQWLSHGQPKKFTQAHAWPTQPDGEVVGSAILSVDPARMHPSFRAAARDAALMLLAIPQGNEKIVAQVMERHGIGTPVGATEAL